MKTPINNFDEGYGIARCAGWRGATLVVGGLWLVVAPCSLAVPAATRRRGETAHPADFGAHRRRDARPSFSMAFAAAGSTQFLALSYSTNEKRHPANRDAVA